MKRKILIRAVIVLSVVFVLLCGATVALMFRQTSLLTNEFDTAIVDCVVRETTDTGSEIATSKSSITVQNTGNIPAYIRVRFVSYWVDGNGNIVSKPSQMPAVTVADGWVVGSDNTYYYSKPIAPNAATPNLLSGSITLVEEDGCLQVVEVFADAIQSKPEEAVTGSWRVAITAGEITSAP